jgi:hypothetical protein
MEVPSSTEKGNRRLSLANSVGLEASVKAASMLTPGAVISGCN